ncbi:MAG: DUF3189 family protein [Firmicutes bacterium]|nr:DUF3189 family protein [Bacillota bacterium]
MRLFYYCYGRAHSSVVAGLIHLNRLPRDRVPNVNEIISAPGFDQSNQPDIGIPYFLGKDRHNNEVFIIGFGSAPDLGLQTIYYLLAQMGNPLEWKFYNSLASIGWLTKIGGFISKKLKVSSIGKYLAALGIQNSYSSLVELVKNVEENEQ